MTVEVSCGSEADFEIVGTAVRSGPLAVIGMLKATLAMRPNLASLTPPKPSHYDGLWNA